MNKNSHETVNTIGLWLLRLVLVGSAIYCSVTGKNDIAGTLSILVFISFVIL